MTTSRHALEEYYDLSSAELLDAINCRFRLKVAVGGAVAEVQMEKHVARLDKSLASGYEAHDIDGHPDFSIHVPGLSKPLLAECKNARNECYQSKGKIVNYRVELQKTRAAKGDPTSRSYGVDQFQILGVCLGVQTGDWKQFMFIRTADIPRQPLNQKKLQVMNRVPVIGAADMGAWSMDLGEIVRKFLQ